MMGWKGALRSLEADLRRQAREDEKRQRQYLKAVEKEDARQTVDEQNQHLDKLRSLHKYCRADMNWNLIESEPEPIEPENNEPLTQKAKDRLDGFSPNFWHKALKIENWRRERLAKSLKRANFLDEENHAFAMAKYDSEKGEWKKKQDFAKRLKTDKEALIDVLQEYLQIEDLPIGRDVAFSISDGMRVDVSLKVLPIDEVIPDEEYSLRQSGTLSTKKMATSKAIDLYQDYLCSALLRVARETLGTIPSDMIRANTLLKTVNTQTGHLEDQVIISAIIPRETLNQINLPHIDPSDAMRNFMHNMNCQKTKGFQSVEKVDFPA